MPHNQTWTVRLRRLLVLAAIASPASAAPVTNVVHISVDALRGDLLKGLVANTPAAYPNFARLQAQSAYTYNARSDFDFTETIPNHASILTGRPVLQPAGKPNTVHHGYSTNFPGAADTLHANGNPAVPYKASVFDVAHDNGLSTALYASKTRLNVFDRSYNATNGGLDTTGPDNGRDKIDTTMTVDGGSAGITNAMIAAATKNYTFIHLVEPDTVGHATGWGNAQWNASVGVIDSRLGQIFNWIDGTPALAGKTAIVLTADHGGGVNVHLEETAPENYTVPLFVWGAGLPAGADLYSLTSNRFDPALGRPDYNAAQQPLRNGDSGNLALGLLGLNPIPGSTMVPVLVPEPSAAVTGGLLAVAGLRRRRRDSRGRAAARRV